jgi:uncharacterized protein (TIGR01777 family)
MRTVLITGATGLVGQHLVNLFLDNQISVNYLSTNKEKLKDQLYYKGYFWNPSTGEIDDNCFNNVSVIINLAGSSIAQRWTDKCKQNIISSRLNSINLLFSTIKRKQLNIEHFITVSGIGYYPFSDINFYDEDFKTDESGFMIKVVNEWEKAANKFQEENIPVSIIRLGMVLSDKGGALPQLIKPIRGFMGSCFGSGNQWQSWIHIDDVSQMFLYIMTNKLYGTFNGVAPNPVIQKVLINQIAKILRRPLILPKIPEIIMKIILGDMHVLITKGQRVSSKKIEKLGFQYKFYQLETALKDLII